MSQQTSRTESLFAAAAEMAPAAERAAFLDRECAGDAALREAVEALLRGRNGVGSGFPDATLIVAQPDATLLMPEPGNAGATVSPQPLHREAAGIGTARDVAKKAPVTLPAESYAVGVEIARGGMGTILEAEDRKLGRMVAMKVMRLEADATEDQRRRFVREAEVLARLEHPNIVPIHDLGRDAEGRLFYTMKLVQGRTLQAILNGLKTRDADFTAHYTLDRLLTIFRKICDALSMAHAKGIIHRDLKPENVMVGEFGEVLVMDWGIAKILGDAAQVAEESARKAEATAAGTAGKFRNLADEELRRGSAELTMDGMVMGTPHYMSPEQADGRVSEIDQQSDVFSLGAILYALLTLHPPVEAATIREVLERIRRGDIRPPTEYNAPTVKTGTKGQSLAGAAVDPKQFQPLVHCPGGKVPPALSAVTMKALTVDKARRYPTVAAFAADIEKYQSGFATQAEHASFMKQIILLVRRNKGIFVTGFVAWLLITALAVWFMINLRAKEKRAVAGEQSAIASELAAKAEAERATKAEQNAKASEAVAVEKGEAARQSLAKAALNLAEAAQREGNGPEMQAALGEVPEDLRDSTWHYLLEQSDSSFARIRSVGRQIDSVAADPRRPGVFAIADSSGKVILLEVRTGVHLLEFAPVFPPKSSGRIMLAFSPDGERIAVGRQKAGLIVIHSARDGKKLLEWEAPGTRQLEFSPDGRQLLQTEVDSILLTAWDAATGQPRWKYEPSGKQIMGTFTPDSQQLVTHGFHDHVRLVSAQDGTLVRPLSNGDAGAFAVRPDGKMVVIGGRTDGRIKGVLLQDGKVLFEARAHDRSFQHLAFTPDGARFVTVAELADGRQAIQLWDANTGAPLQMLLGGSGSIDGAGVHPLSGELVVAGPSSRAWNLTGTPEKWTLRGGDDSSIAFWGSDEVVFAAVGGQDAALQKLQAGSPELLWKQPGGDYRHPSVSADGRFAAIGFINGDASQTHDVFLLRNPGAQTEQTAVFQQTGGFTLLRLSPTGDHLAAITRFNGSVALYDAATGQQPVKLERKDMSLFRDLGWLSGGQQLVGLVTAKAKRGNPGSEEWIVLWDAATGKIVQTATHRTAMDVLAVAPDGRRFAEAGADKKVRIRDAATLAVQQEFRAHDGPITALAWHPTKPIVATASADLSVKVWNIETGRRLEEFRGMLTAPDSLAFSPSGQRLGCAGNNNPTRIWEPPSLNDQPAAAKPADGWEDLLAPLTPAALMRTGNGWRMENGALFSPGKPFATLPLSGNLSGTSYQVRVKLRQLTAKNVFHLALPVADRMVGFDMDGSPADGFYTTLLRVNGKMGKNVPGAVHGKQVKDSEQHDLEVIVRLDGTNATITTTLDGQPLYEWTGPTADLSQHEKWITPPGTLALGTVAADWVVYEVKVKRLEK